MARYHLWSGTLCADLDYWDIHVYPSPVPVGTKSKISDHLFGYLAIDLGSLLLILRLCLPDQVAESQNQLILNDQESI